MKKEKKYLALIISLVVVVIALFTIIFVVLNKDKKTTSDNKPVKINDKILTCSKNSEAIDTYTSIEEYIINVDSKGNVSKYNNRYIYTYKTKEEYDKLKKADFGELKVEFDDTKKQMTKNYVYDKMLNNENQEITIWYKDFQKSLEDKGYVCK